VSGNILAADLKEGAEVATLGGQKLKIVRGAMLYGSI
jgi:hypothetical protein